jgi:hypothetical protein
MVRFTRKLWKQDAHEGAWRTHVAVPRGGPTWVKSTWAWHTHETPSSNSYRITSTSSFTSAMHLSIVGLPPLVGHMYRRVVIKLFLESQKEGKELVSKSVSKI